MFYHSIGKSGNSKPYRINVNAWIIIVHGLRKFLYRRSLYWPWRKRNSRIIIAPPIIAFSSYTVNLGLGMNICSLANSASDRHVPSINVTQFQNQPGKATKSYLLYSGLLHRIFSRFVWSTFWGKPFGEPRLNDDDDDHDGKWWWRWCSIREFAFAKA